MAVATNCAHSFKMIKSDMLKFLIEFWVSATLDHKVLMVGPPLMMLNSTEGQTTELRRSPSSFGPTAKGLHVVNAAAGSFFNLEHLTKFHHLVRKMSGISPKQLSP
ncbi:hypothetical protein FHL15_000099 [Xylaria flabelliformis]|uniref:Uncharacterized protein n=1 Tax=Xylaria flabelliformis TaxID=2512241 RepID=A0A553IEZ6_9PEZI|nr:hypothetical protein FHL15_000099 [Xylaria flabelliformis]